MTKRLKAIIEADARNPEKLAFVLRKVADDLDNLDNPRGVIARAMIGVAAKRCDAYLAAIKADESGKGTDPPKRRTFVIAGNQFQYGAYCRSKGLRPGRDVVYVVRDEILHGLDSADFILTGTYQTHTYWERIELTIRLIPDHTVKHDPY